MKSMSYHVELNPDSGSVSGANVNCRERAPLIVVLCSWIRPACNTALRASVMLGRRTGGREPRLRLRLIGWAGSRRSWQNRAAEERSLWDGSPMFCPGNVVMVMVIPLFFDVC